MTHFKERRMSASLKPLKDHSKSWNWISCPFFPADFCVLLLKWDNAERQVFPPLDEDFIRASNFEPVPEGIASCGTKPAAKLGCSRLITFPDGRLQPRHIRNSNFFFFLFVGKDAPWKKKKKGWVMQSSICWKESMTTFLHFHFLSRSRFVLLATKIVKTVH